MKTLEEQLLMKNLEEQMNLPKKTLEEQLMRLMETLEHCCIS